MLTGEHLFTKLNYELIIKNYELDYERKYY